MDTTVKNCVQDTGSDGWLPAPTTPGIWIFGYPGEHLSGVILVSSAEDLQRPWRINARFKCVYGGQLIDPGYRVPADPRRWHGREELTPGIWWCRDWDFNTNPYGGWKTPYVVICNERRKIDAFDKQYAYVGPLPTNPPSDDQAKETP